MGLYPNENPSEKQLEIIQYIIKYVEENGFQPSYSEMADYFGISKTAIQNRIRGLIKRSMIEDNATGRERALAIRGIRYKAYVVEEEGLT